jgi:hypothetical protein
MFKSRIAEDILGESYLTFSRSWRKKIGNKFIKDTMALLSARFLNIEGTQIQGAIN